MYCNRAARYSDAGVTVGYRLDPALHRGDWPLAHWPLDTGLQASVAPLDTGLQASVGPLDTGLQASVAPLDTGLQASVGPLVEVESLLSSGCHEPLPQHLLGTVVGQLEGEEGSGLIVGTEMTGRLSHRR